MHYFCAAAPLKGAPVKAHNTPAAEIMHKCNSLAVDYYTATAIQMAPQEYVYFPLSSTKSVSTELNTQLAASKPLSIVCC